MRVLVACEESGVVREAFRKLGHDAWSCDLLPTSQPSPYHIQGDVTPVLPQGWDLIIGHPPCTYLAVSGAQWYYHPEDKHLPVEQRRPHPRYPNRRADRQAAIDFFMAIANAPCERIAIENPVGAMSKAWRKPDQVIQPFQFGHPEPKTTCLWLKNLPPLVPTNVVEKGEYIEYASGKRLPKWYSDVRSSKDRQTLRSKTFQGIADAMAAQWGGPAEVSGPAAVLTARREP